MPGLNIHPDPIKLAMLEASLSEFPQLVAVAERDALNKSMTHGVAVAASDLAAEMTTSRGSVRKRLTFLKATKAKLSAAMIVRGGRGVNLVGFGARETGSGVSVRIFGQRKAIPHAFITRGVGPTGGFDLGATGNKIVALREGDKRPMKKGRYAGRLIKRGPRAGQPITRQPIVAQYGPTVAEAWEKTPGVAQHTVDEFNNSFGPNIQNQIKRFENG